MQKYNIDPELLAGFIDESYEGLEPLDTLFIELEKYPEDLELVNTIFRPIHSIKGSSAFFGLLKIKILAHKMEDLLDKIRQKRMKASKRTIRVLLPGLDMLRTMFENVRSGGKETDDEAEFQKIMDSIIEVWEKDDKEVDAEVVENAAALIENLLVKLAELKPHIHDEFTYLIDEAEEILSRITSNVIVLPDMQNAGTVGAEKTGDYLEPILDILKTPIQDLLDDEMSRKVREELTKLQQAADSPETESIVSEAVEEYDAFMENIGFDALLQEVLTDKMEVLREIGKWKTEKKRSVDTGVLKKKVDTTIAPGVPTERRSGADRRTESVASSEKTMRVSEKKIDSFLSYVSELVVIEEMFNYLQKKLITSTESNIASEFKRVIETFGSLSNELRKSILSIRMIPARTVIQKAPRIVHDIAAAGNKKVDVHIQGDDIQIDKSYVEMLDAPFTHMVRNAVDHGIEQEEERVAAGKPVTGSIRITLRETKKDIELVINDDGRGLDYEAISRKAEKIGIISKGKILDEDAVVDLLFMSGVSTAKEVTDVSGRGVGMDVAKKNVEAFGGQIKIKSEKGRGSTFVISLPKSVSTQIMEGFLVRAGGEIYVMPMELIGESFALKSDDISTVEGKGEMVLRRGELYPIVRLGRDLNKNYGKSNKNRQEQNDAGKESIAISLVVKNSRHALCVDEIIGVHKVVVREIDGMMVEEELFDGAAMLGDGRVAMIIGKSGLYRLARGAETLS
jgi:two-component system, chemotaxis family, sensor kinase CheA